MHRAQRLPRVVGREWVDAGPDRHRQTGRQTARQKLCSLCNVTHTALRAWPSQPRANRITDQQKAGIRTELWSSPSPTPPPPPKLSPAAAAQIPLSLPAAQPWGSQPPQEELQTPTGSPSTSQTACNRGALHWVQCSGCVLPIAQQSWEAPPCPAGPSLGNHQPSGPPERTAGSRSAIGQPLVKYWSTTGRAAQRWCAAHGHHPAQVGALRGAPQAAAWEHSWERLWERRGHFPKANENKRL